MSRAAASRGKADIDALRAFASIVGFGGEIEGMLGVSNSSDPSGEMIEKALSGLGSAVASKLESPKERRIKLALSVTLAILLCELAQLTIVLTASWLFGAGVSAAPRGLLPFGAALGVALQSRALTRPLRLVAEAWDRPCGRVGPPTSAALRGALLAIGAVAAFCALLTKADAYLCMRGQSATSIYGVQMLMATAMRRSARPRPRGAPPHAHPHLSDEADWPRAIRRAAGRGRRVGGGRVRLCACTRPRRGRREPGPFRMGDDHQAFAGNVGVERDGRLDCEQRDGALREGSWVVLRVERKERGQ